VTLACSAPPAGRARWTLQLLADQLVTLAVVATISDETVRRTLKKTCSSPGGRRGRRTDYSSDLATILVTIVQLTGELSSHLI
jgi:hypothetical protein